MVLCLAIAPVTVTEAATVNAPSTRASDDTVVNIPDANLRAAINWQLARRLGTTRADTAAITGAEMRALTYLITSAGNSMPAGRKIRDLTGLEHATNLTQLWLHRHEQISDVTPLAGLTKLRELLLYGNPISDVTPLAGLTALVHLSLSDTNVSDLRPLAGLTALHHLGLRNTPLAGNIQPLANLKGLRSLILDNTGLTDIKPLAGLTALWQLSLANNQIRDITPLSGKNNLTHLRLRNNEISEIAPLMGLQRMRHPDLRENPLNYHATRNIGILKGNGIPVQYTQTASDVPIPDPLLRARINRALGSERAADAVITEAEMLSLTGLSVGAKRLGPAAQQITDIRGLSYARNLTYLSLAHNNVTDLTPLSGLTKLTGMTLQRNLNLTDVSPIAKLTKLTYLNLWRCQVSDISPLRSLTSLASFPARGNPIADISPMQNWTALRWTDLGANERITELGPLVANTALNSPGGYIYVARNGKLSYETIYTQIPGLIANRVRVLFDSRVPGRPFIASGNNQTGTVGTPLASPLVVQVNDTADPPVPFEGVPITWTVTSGGGTLQNAATKTDANGQASAGLLLGSSLGTNTVTASVSHGGLTRMLTFTATGDPMVARQEDEGDGEGDGDDGGNNGNNPHLDYVDALDEYRARDSDIKPAKNVVNRWSMLKTLYYDKIKDTLDETRLNSYTTAITRDGTEALKMLLSMLGSSSGDTLRERYDDVLDGLDLAHEDYINAIGKADTAYDEYVEAARAVEREPKPKEDHGLPLFVKYECGNDRCYVRFDTRQIGYGTNEEGERWSARVAASNAHREYCRVDSRPPCNSARPYWGLCPGGASGECTTKERHLLPCTNYGNCNTKFPQLSFPPGEVNDSPHHCTEKVKGGLGKNVKCGSFFNSNRYCGYRGRTDESLCKNRLNHLITGECGHPNVPRHETEGSGLHTITKEQCLYREVGRNGRRCQRMEYYRCGWWHGDNVYSGHRYAVESPSQETPPVPQPVPPTPQTPAPQTPAPQTPVPETPVPVPVPETPVPVPVPEPETPVPEPEAPAPRTPTPQTPTPQTPDPEEEEDPPEAPEAPKEDPPPPPPPPPPRVRCGNRWTGPGHCSEGGTASSRNAHRTRCSAGHRYWGCNVTGDAWHKTRVCERKGCGRYYTKCKNGPRGNNPCPRNPGGWHDDFED